MTLTEKLRYLASSTQYADPADAFRGPEPEHCKIFVDNVIRNETAASIAERLDISRPTVERRVAAVRKWLLEGT